MKRSVLIISYWVEGMGMGMPISSHGVSGGTIAFITGIYQNLIDSIRSVVNAGLIRILFRRDWPPHGNMPTAASATVLEEYCSAYSLCQD